MDKPVLTIWEISPPIGNYEETDLDPPVFRWTYEAYGIFVTSSMSYAHKGHCSRRGTEWVLKHNYGVPKIKHDQRSNWEFLA